ncbi:MAG: CoB--CoM heterodisulfide reductase iron-sulfur subunit A family protein [bacterium]|nr:CoB--CoM heterodisulfide reductase iron-sulfur subunit A family protein [bacterium]
MMDAGRHPGIELHTLSELTGLRGRAGAFRATVRKHPRYVDPELCVACGRCTDVCPQVRPNPYDIGLKSAKAIDRLFPQAVPAAYHIDKDVCLNDNIMYCERCIRACEPDAIDFDQREETLELEIGSVIVATGFDELDPRELLPFGYGSSRNVLTGLEFERLLCATGPTGGHVVRPTDLKVPERILFVQCVGSRGEGGRSYCSRYCCMNSVKSAMLAHEHEPTLKGSTLLFTDMRADGRGYDAFVERCLERDQISTMRGRPAKIEENPETGDLSVWVEDFEAGRPTRIEAGMVVLSSAALPAGGTPELGRILRIELDESGFVKRKCPDESPTKTTRPGIYVAGSAGSPAIIPECVAQGAAAASAASTHVLAERNTKEQGEHVAPIDSSGPPRIGVFVCHCGANIAGVVNVQELREEAAKLPGVVYAGDEHFACAEISQKVIEEVITEHKLNRIVVAACTPRTHEPVFRDVLSRRGLNPFLFEMVNIRDQCTWVHSDVPDEAQARARDQIRMSVARAARLEPLTPIRVDVNRRVVVIGGGISGIRVALDLAAQEFEVTLVEVDEQMGGVTAKLGTAVGEPGQALTTLKRQLKRSPVRVLRQTDIARVDGYVGNFILTLHPGEEELTAGAIVLAIGAKPYDPTGRFGFGTKSNVITNLDLERRLRDESDVLGGGEGGVPATAVIIQCVGSRCREEGCNQGCSRYCCPSTVKQALKLAALGTRVTVLYRDMRMVGPGMEALYREARGAGVLFVRVPDGGQMTVVGDTLAEAVVADDMLPDREIEAPAELVILAVGLVPDNELILRIKELLKTPVGPDGFLMERHPELGPVETVVDGVFVCGTVTGAKSIADSLAEAGAAAGKVSRLLSRQALTLEPTVAEVDRLLCRACGKCVEICEYQAPSLADDMFGLQAASINKASCKGCGTCVSWCPTGAIKACHFTDGQIEAMMETMLQWEKM